MSNPAQVIIEKFGGPAKVAELCKCDISRVHRWTYPKDRGGSDGIIPTKQQNVLLARAPEVGVSLTRDEFFHPVSKADHQKGGLTLQPILASKTSNASLRRLSKSSASTHEAAK